jgi:hypothetical protein
MKTKVCFPFQMSLFVKFLVLSAMLFSLTVQPTRAATPASIVGGHITTDITWNLSGSPYQVDTYIYVDAGITLTIDAGVIVMNYSGGGSNNYEFTVEGTLIANGTLSQEIYFDRGTGWSGIIIKGQPGDINTGSSLSFVVLEGGGFGGSGVGANLRLQYAVVDVHDCQFNHSPGDGILGDDAGAQGSANIYDSFFTENAGYAVNFEDGSVNPVLDNLSATGNGATVPYDGNLVVVNDATLHGNHTWENMGLPYLILQTIVASDAVLTIEPGVQILAQPGNDALDVQGTLVAYGSTSQVIHFDPADAASGWSGIAIMGTEGYPSAGGWLDHVSITKGGFTGGSCDLYMTYGNATVTNSQLDSSEDSGVCLDHGATLTMTDTQLTNNQEYAMDVIDANARFSLDNLTATGNMSDTIGVEGGTLVGNHTWSKSGINTYDLYYGYVTIAPTGTLNIDPGVTVLFGVTRDITVHGTLTALGTPSNPIVFTGETYTPGLWSGLTFEGTPEQHAVGRFAYSTIEYGGYGGSAMVSIQNADVTFTHCVLRYCTADAIRILPDMKLATLPVSPRAAQPVQINWSKLYDVGEYSYAINNLASQVVQAAYNWWGAASGPTADDNPGGTGSALYGLVDYRPYLTTPNSSYIFMPLVTR